MAELILNDKGLVSDEAINGYDIKPEGERIIGTKSPRKDLS